MSQYHTVVYIVIMSLRRNPDRRVRQRTADNVETNNNNNNNNNNIDGPPAPPPPQILPPAGNNNNQVAINDELAAAAADAAAAPVVDPYAILAQQSNSDRPWVTALQNARNGIGQSISEAVMNKGRVDLNSQRLFHIPQLGIFGKDQTRVAGGPIFLKCFYSSTFSGGTCPAIIRKVIGHVSMVMVVHVPTPIYINNSTSKII